MQKRKNIFLKLAMLTVLLEFVMAATRAEATLVPFDTYLPDVCQATLHSVLDGMEGVEKYELNGWYSQPVGVASFEDGNTLPDGIQLWFIAANDKQVIGEIVLEWGFGDFGFLGTDGIYGNDPSTFVDDGAAFKEPIIVFAEINGYYHQGCFTTPPLDVGWDFTDASDGHDDIAIKIPEPATLVLLGVSVLCLFLWRRPKLT